MYGKELAYVALVVDDVEAAARMWEKDFGLLRSEHQSGDRLRRVPLLSVGRSALALFAPGDPDVDGETQTGVHHIALAVDDVQRAAKAIEERGVRGETGQFEPGLDGRRRVLLSLDATNGTRTYLTDRVERPTGEPGFAERLDHLGVIGTDNDRAIDVFSNRLGCPLLGEQTDTEMQIAVEHFVYKSNGIVRTVVHNRPAEFVAAVHDLFIAVGDCELEIIQPLKTAAQFRASGNQAGDTKQDHGAIARFLERRGPGLHHIALRVSDIDARLERLRSAGHRMIDQRGRPGARCSRIGFVHPKSTRGVLTHLVDRPEQI